MRVRGRSSIHYFRPGLKGGSSSIYYSRRSLLKGMSRILDLVNTLRKRPTVLTRWKGDTFALMTDWEMVGQDIREAIGTFKVEEADRLTPVE